MGLLRGMNRREELGDVLAHRIAHRDIVEYSRHGCALVGKHAHVSLRFAQGKRLFQWLGLI